MGLASYYRRFIEGFAEIAVPLNKLTHKESTFKWNDACQNAFITLKERLISSPILSYPEMTGQFILDTDACDVAIGAVLSQEQNGVEKVIAYSSRTLSKTESKYCVTRKELLAVVFHCKHFQHYLYGQRFLVRTDHGSLRWLFRFKNPEGQMARWLEVLSTFDFEVQHRPGRQHGNADGLSRLPCRQCGNCETEGSLNVEKFVPESVDVRVRHSNAVFQSVDFCEDESSYTSVTDKRYCTDTSIDDLIHTDEPLLTSPTVKDSDSAECCSESKSLNGHVLTSFQDKDGKCFITNGNSATVASCSLSNSSALVVSPLIEFGCDLDMLRSAQHVDENLKLIIQWLECNKRPDWEEMSSMNPELKALWAQLKLFVMVDGVLCRKWEITTTDHVAYKIVVPKSMRNDILFQLHNSLTSGHLGMSKTIEKVRARFYWANMKSDIQDWCNCCHVCAQRKPLNKRHRGSMKIYQVGAPMERIATDILGPLPLSKKGNRYILIVSDYFTKWVEAYALPNQLAETVAGVIVTEFIARFGVCLEIHSDQGRNYECKLFHEVCRLLGINKNSHNP